MIIIFDFDHTLFDMMAMHEALFGAVRKLGINREQYDEAYLAVTHWKMFTPQAFAHRLHKVGGLDVGQVLAALQSVAERSDEFLYPDSAETIKRLNDAGHEVSILTWGDEAWQRAKVRHAGLEPYCRNVFCLSKPKHEFLLTWCPPNRSAILVDDKPAEMKPMQEHKLPMRLVRMRRGNAKYSDQETPAGMLEITDLKGLFDLLKQGDAPMP